MELEGKVVAITGAGGFLARAIALGLKERGARLALLDRDADGLEAAKCDCGAEISVVCDLTDEDCVWSGVQRIIEEMGPITGLVNAVGWIHSQALTSFFGGPESRHDLATWQQVVNANLTAPFVVGSAVAQTMICFRTRGVIINVSSVSAGGVAGQSAYSAAKSGLNTLSKVWAQELGPLGIRCVALAPGFIDVQTTRGALGEEAMANREREAALRRLGVPDEVVSAVLFTFENDFLTDTVLEIDGGIRA